MVHVVVSTALDMYNIFKNFAVSHAELIGACFHCDPEKKTH